MITKQKRSANVFDRPFFTLNKYRKSYIVVTILQSPHQWHSNEYQYFDNLDRFARYFQ